MARRRSWLSPSPTPSGLVSGPTASGRRGRFIVLGSSGEHLPVNRKYKLSETSTSQFSSCNSSLEEYHSAKGSSIDEGIIKINSKLLLKFNLKNSNLYR